MLTSEAARRDLYTGLAELLGSQRAETLMTHLPGYDPVDVATKADIADLRTDANNLESRLNLRFDGIDSRFDSIDSRFDSIDNRFDSIDNRFDSIDSRFAGLGERLDRLFLTLLAGLFVVVAAMAGVVFAIL